ncbi:probable PBS2-tyrosine protein kinase of the MAPKK family [Sporisorium reilianum SRZ2]|uniref:mitogen-activated protein kinase kinase n=1 Tax=Sporisorium reilianum (strain SRZ2) TaxID=999809 RepID=E6ZZ73_SPORE|nr:probable PBS2-tyrosine protein kinase of the MAPKK family [Sporisorium reilianum SRZ2]
MTDSVSSAEMERLTAQMSLKDTPQNATGGPPPRAAPSSSGASPSLRPTPGTGGPSAARSTPNTAVGAAERARQMAGARLPPSLQAKLAANANRSTISPNPGQGVMGHDQRIDSNASASLFVSASNRPGTLPGTGMGGLAACRGVPGALGGPSTGGPGSPSAAAAAAAGMGARRNRPGLKLSDLGIGAGDAMDGTQKSGMGAGAGRRAPPPGRLSDSTGSSKAGDVAAQQDGGAMSTPFSNFSKIVDPSGRLNFSGKAVLHASGVEFGNGTSFKINMAELELMDELGKGNYGTVRKVRHTQTHVEMAMKEIRLELDESKLNAIIMELDILHRATAPQIVEFYGAFFIESCVYYCMEYMNAGSLDKLYGERGSVPEDVLARITGSMVRGLSFLKDQLQIMHRDVKPTNVLINRKGQVKLCDFGVSGQLEKSLAKTNIGCQSYMAPERIKGESQNMLGTYTVASDVWSLGLSMVETTLGTYPYPPETYSNVFAQLQAIVHGDPPELPAELYSETARDFVAQCLEKIASRRPTYAQLLKHEFLTLDEAKGEQGVDMVGWVERAIEARNRRKEMANGAATPGSSSSGSAA